MHIDDTIALRHVFCYAAVCTFRLDFHSKEINGFIGAYQFVDMGYRGVSGGDTEGIINTITAGRIKSRVAVGIG